MSQKVERCCKCDEPTGRAGAGDDSLYYDGIGPYCTDCFSKVIPGLKDGLKCSICDRPATEKFVQNWYSKLWLRACNFPFGKTIIGAFDHRCDEHDLSINDSEPFWQKRYKRREVKA